MEGEGAEGCDGKDSSSRSNNSCSISNTVCSNSGNPKNSHSSPLYDLYSVDILQKLRIHSQFVGILVGISGSHGRKVNLWKNGEDRSHDTVPSRFTVVLLIESSVSTRVRLIIGFSLKQHLHEIFDLGFFP